jgi:hypothetical protein
MEFDEDHSRRVGWTALKSGVDKFLDANNCKRADVGTIKKIGRFILALTSTEPEIPLAGKKLRNLSTKQRILFQSERYEGEEAEEFLGHWIGPESRYGDFYFVFSRRSVKVANENLLNSPGTVHKTLAKLCHERPDPVIPYEKLAMAVPRFVKDLRGNMRFLSIDRNARFENSDTAGNGCWFRTEPINVLLSILDHQDVHIHQGRNFLAIYTRWFGAYFGKG